MAAKVDGWDKSNNLDKRIETHSSGQGSKYTRSRLLVELVYYEPAENRSEVTRRELEIKGLSREEKMKMV
jgi:putative endonuclease